jgi:glycosyltransferase involved in cell wall biosynthesis
MNEDAPKVSVVIPLRNRGGVRLDNCLRSLRWQDVDPASVEIILSDFGSDAPFAAELADLAQGHGARVVRTETSEIWNRSRALNFGIRAAQGAFVLATDADMIFAPNFLASLLAAQASHDAKAMAVCRCRDLPQSVPERPWTREDYPSLVAQAPYREKLGTGACQMAPRAFFEDVRGYDEAYKFWGMEDNDMRHRSGIWGLRLTWVHDGTSMLHQWHPSDRGRRPLRKMLNDVRFHLTKWRVRKNPSGWGGG